jgi:hypothetical protein
MVSEAVREKLKAAIRDNPDDLDKAVDEIIRIVTAPGPSPWWDSPARWATGR